MIVTSRVINIYKQPNYAGAVYIGRKHNTIEHYGNPFPINSKQTRNDVIRMYEDWLRGTMHKDIEPERRQWILDNLDFLKDKVLSCFCKPNPCHGDVLIKLLKEKYNE